jgi:hypothetical protein
VRVPKRQTGQSNCSVRKRTKLSRLHGADLYVARLGWKKNGPADKPVACCADLNESVEVEPPPSPSTGSLHEELLNSQPQAKKIIDKAVDGFELKAPSVLSSRPCYRCISHMSSVGIKRVFWTTSAGTWESAKVRDLVDALENVGLEQSSDVPTTLGNVFVTRRTMGHLSY